MRRSNLIARLIGLLMMLVLMAACQNQSNGVQTIPPPVLSPAPTPTPQALPTQITEGPVASPTPSGLVVGTVIIDQTLTLDVAQPAPQEIVFQGKANVVIRIQATRQNTEIDYRLSLLDKYGTRLAQVDSVLGGISEIISEFPLPYDGDYRLSITPTAGAGTVQISATVIEGASGGGDFELLPIQSSGSMAAFGVYHLFKFRLTKGDTISAGVDANGGELTELSLTLIGPDGRIVAEGSQNHRGYIVPATGTYQAIVSNPRGGSGEYTFHVSSDVVLPTPSDTADIGYDQEYRATFANNSVLSVTFDGTLGDFLQIAVTDPDRGLDIDIYLYSPYDHIIAFAADGALNEVQLPYTGRYRLELRPTGTGEAAFSVARLPAEQLSGGGVFGESIRETRSSAFTAANVFHFYQFTAVPDETVSITIQLSDTSDLDMAMVILGPSGQEVAFVESSESASFGLNAIRLQQTGTYTIIVYALDATEGLYDLTFVRE